MQDVRPNVNKITKQPKKKKRKRRWFFKGSILAAALFCGFMFYYLEKTVPDRLNIVAGEEEQMQLPVLFESTLVMKDAEVSLGDSSNIPSNQIRISGKEPFQMLGKKQGSYQMEVKLFGLVKIKDVQVDVVDENYAVPCGIPVGIYLKSNGILVIGTGNLMGIDGIEVEPAYGVLRSGDYIEAINGHPLSRKEDLVQAVNQTGGGRVTLQIRRGQEKMSVSMNPVAAEDGTYKLGAWVRDDTQGIGTMTYLDLRKGISMKRRLWALKKEARESRG